jgi:CRP/FNR family transcriptional regulator
MYAQGLVNTTSASRIPVFAASAPFGHQPEARLASLASSQRVEPGRFLFSEGDDAENVYEITQGILKLYKLLPDGRRQITGFVSTGSLVGWTNADVYLYGAEAVTEVKLRRYRRSQFDRLIDEVPGFARRVLAANCGDLRAAQEQMLLLGRKSAVEKVASFLMGMIQLHGHGDDSSAVHVSMRRADIADYLGLTIETVSRTLTKLKREGIIVIPTPTEIRLRDRDQLEELAAGELAEAA